MVCRPSCFHVAAAATALTALHLLRLLSTVPSPFNFTLRLLLFALALTASRELWAIFLPPALVVPLLLASSVGMSLLMVWRIKVRSHCHALLNSCAALCLSDSQVCQTSKSVH